MACKQSLVKKIVIVDAFCCDCPAKSFILSVKGHAGYSSCIRCKIEGERINNTTCFLETDFSKRTHLDFLNRVDEDHHITSTISIVTEIPGINIVEDFTLDYMHLVCLGVMKKMLLLWLGVLKHAPVNVRIPNRSVNCISNNLLLLNTFVPSDFSRKCRGLNEICRFKATEYRLFLLYTGPVVLKDILNDDCYFHFLCLHISFRVFLCPGSSEKLVNFSENLITFFVKNFSELYGPQFVSHNVHGLLHIVDDYRKFKSLEECSCFPFENYMKVLKKMVRKHEKPLEQVIKRYQESLLFNQPVLLKSPKEINYRKPHSNGPSAFEHLTVPNFQIVIKNNIKINIKSTSDSYIGFTDETGLKIFKVFNICLDSTTEKYVFLVKHFETIGNFFDKPISSLKLGIAVVKNLSEFYSIIDIENTEFVKYMILSSNSNVNIAYPILHTFII